MEDTRIRASNAIRNTALGLLGMFIGAVIFVMGLAVGMALSRPGATLFGGASPFAFSTLTSDTRHGTGAAQSGDSLDYALIEDVLSRLREQWYGEMPSREKLTDGAIKGMVSALGDPYTQYVEPRFAKILNEDISGTFEGIGATLKQTPGGSIQIVRTLPGTPAEKAGILPGDIIEAVDGQSVMGLNTTEVAAMVRGPRGTQVRLTLRRADQPKPFDVVLTRARITIPLVESRMIDEIAYIRLFDFSQQASRQLERDLRELLGKKPKGLILDLRDNPGGLLSQAREVGDIFLDAGVFIIERDYKGNEKVTRTTNRGIAQDIPLVVLVNGGSASASEIVAGAIQDRQRGVVIGERTFGKGSVQSPQTLANGAQLRITIERWFTPNNRSIQDEGIVPDFTVVNTPEDQQKNRDPQLDAAVEYLKTGKAPKSASPSR